MDGKLHPCAFYSRRLTPAERNYDVGNSELLALVMALQEWHHWLEGGQRIIYHLDRPQEPGLPLWSQAAEL